MQVKLRYSLFLVMALRIPIKMINEIDKTCSSSNELMKEIENLYARSTLLFSEHDIQRGLDKMAAEITAQLSDKNPLVICVMTGGLIPMGHLLTRLNFNLQTDYVHATRYQGEFEGGEIHWVAKPRTNVEGRTILIVDDILDAGITLAVIQKELFKMGAKDVQTAVMVDKRRERPIEGIQKANYVGLEVDDKFIFGFGLDYKGYLRNLAGIYEVET
jgi:hypoxanthine phosphoribosyltransferase